MRAHDPGGFVIGNQNVVRLAVDEIVVRSVTSVVRETGSKGELQAASSNDAKVHVNMLICVFKTFLLQNDDNLVPV